MTWLRLWMLRSQLFLRSIKVVPLNSKLLWRSLKLCPRSFNFCMKLQSCFLEISCIRTELSYISSDQESCSRKLQSGYAEIRNVSRIYDFAPWRSKFSVLSFLISSLSSVLFTPSSKVSARSFKVVFDEFLNGYKEIQSVSTNFWFCSAALEIC